VGFRRRGGVGRSVVWRMNGARVGVEWYFGNVSCEFVSNNDKPRIVAYRYNIEAGCPLRAYMYHKGMHRQSHSANHKSTT
jgi:hypothetical protein